VYRRARIDRRPVRAQRSYHRATANPRQTVLALIAFYVNQFAAVGGVAVQALLVVAALEHRASMGSADPEGVDTAPSF
jgi:hypothetical protein